jgi:predicted metal-dependent hydrolase
MKSFIQFGLKQIDFHLEYANRKSLGITVIPDSNVIVKAPTGTSLESIKEKLRKKAPWIIKQQSFFLSFDPRTTPRKYISGETHLYLGRQYRLKILPAKVESVKLKGKLIIVNIKAKSRAKQILNNWYLQNAKIKFQAIAAPVIKKFEKYNVKPTSFILREVSTRWGSCAPNGKIILNPELIRAPKGCIEYVVIHELCHLVYHDHTSKFFELQTKEMPGWEIWKSKLEKLLA